MNRAFWKWLLVPCLAVGLAGCEMRVEDGDPDVLVPRVDGPDRVEHRDIDVYESPDVEVRERPDVEIHEAPDVQIHEAPQRDEPAGEPGIGGDRRP